MHSETPWDETYSVGEVASALGIPRSTLLYYETHGIVRPSQADETGYRAYATPDLVRLMGGVVLKNAGVRPRDMDAVLDAHPFSDAHMDALDEALARKIRWHEAVRESLARLRALVGRADEVRDEWVEPTLVCFDGSSAGFHDYPHSKALKALLAAMPVSSLGVVFDCDYFDFASRGSWGRTIPARYADLVEGLPEGLREVGGCRCLTAVKHDDGIYDRRTPENTVSKALRVRMEELGLSQTASAFCPYCLPTEHDGTLTLVCLPVG